MNKQTNEIQSINKGVGGSECIVFAPSLRLNGVYRLRSAEPVELNHFGPFIGRLSALQFGPLFLKQALFAILDGGGQSGGEIG